MPGRREVIDWETTDLPPIEIGQLRTMARNVRRLVLNDGHVQELPEEIQDTVKRVRLSSRRRGSQRIKPNEKP